MTVQALSRDDLSTHGVWLVAPDDAPQPETYRALTGAAGAAASAPLGMAVVAARRAFTRGRPLPPGGVLLGIEAAPGSWSGVGTTAFRCSTFERADSAGRVIVTARVELRSSDRRGWPTLVEFALRWPDEVSRG